MSFGIVISLIRFELLSRGFCIYVSRFLYKTGIVKIWSQVGRKEGDNCSKHLIILFKSFEKTEGSLLCCPFITFLYSPFISDARKGGFKAAVS